MPRKEAPKKELPAVAADLEKEAEFKQWCQTPLDFTSYRKVRQHLQKVAHYHLAGLLEQKSLNAQTYIASAILVTMDRERTHEGVEEDDLKAVLKDCGGTLNLTPEQAMQLMQVPQDEMKVKLIKRFMKENEIVDAEEVLPPPVQEVLEQVEERESWAFP